MQQRMKTEKPVDIYLISSTLHFFWAYMLAQRNKELCESHLVVIDQYVNKPLLMVEYLNDEISPFESVETWTGRELKGFSKLQNRKQKFLAIKEYLKELPVRRVFIGNDRSVVGQFFIKEVKRINVGASSCFLDDGVYSYLGRAASKRWAERYLDSFFKKMVYGLWYDVPKTVGASKWIDEVWVMFPNFVNGLLKQKSAKEVLPSNNSFQSFKPFSELVLKGVNFDTTMLRRLDVLITLPNETVFSQLPGYEKKMNLLIKGLTSQNKSIAIKYHPSAVNKDALNLGKNGVAVLPANLSFELLIPFLENCHVIGDLSTTVLISHYSKCGSVSLLEISEDAKNDFMVDLCKSLGIRVQREDLI